MNETVTQCLLAMPEPRTGKQQGVPKLSEILAPHILEFTPFEQIPDLFLLGYPLLHLHKDQSFLSDTPNGRKMVARQFNPQHRSLAPRCVDVYDHWQKVKT